jgi:drug/metabolite transporter (DMT)-like permease
VWLGIQQNRQKKEFSGPAAIFLCAVLWSTSGLFIKLIDAIPFILAGCRSFIGGIMMIALRVLFMDKPFALLGVALKTPAFWLSGVSYAAAMILFIVANKLTTSANAILVQYSAPVWAAIFGLILIHEKPRIENWLSLAAVIAGLFLFFKDALSSPSMSGDILALISGICFGAQSVFLRMQKEGDPADSMLLAHVITALVSIPFFFVEPPQINPGSLVSILFMGIVQIGIASLLFAYGIRRIPAVQAMLTAVAEPVLNPVWVILVTGEKPGIAALFGGIIIIAAVLVSAFRRN